MASLRKSRTLVNDAAIAKFLYIILKQLDLKSIDWQEVANELDITNGHAARMRFSRFKQQMEGQPAASRKSKPSTPRQKKGKPDKTPAHDQTPIQEQQQSTLEGEPVIKAENNGESEAMQGVSLTRSFEMMVKGEPLVKSEPAEGEGKLCAANANIGIEGVQDVAMRMTQTPRLSGEHMGVGGMEQLSSGLLALKEEPVVKSEPLW